MLGERRASSFRLSFHLNKGSSYHVLRRMCHQSTFMTWSWFTGSSVLWLIKHELIKVK